MMFINKHAFFCLALMPLALGISTLALAASNSESGEVQINVTQATMGAKISIGDSIKAAELESKGKAVDSGLNDENGTATYQVEVLMPNGKRTDVFVDLETGKVVRMADAGSDGEGTDSENGESSDGNSDAGNESGEINGQQ